MVDILVMTVVANYNYGTVCSFSTVIILSCSSTGIPSKKCKLTVNNVSRECYILLKPLIKILQLVLSYNMNIMMNLRPYLECDNNFYLSVSDTGWSSILFKSAVAPS